MKVKVIINPAAANGRLKKHWPIIREALTKTLGEIEESFTTRMGEGIEITKRALLEGFEHVIAVGGDGTVNEVINGFFIDDRPVNPDALFSFIMKGTGGDFIRSFEADRELSDLIGSIAKNEITRIDIGKLTYRDFEGKQAIRYFNNVASFGMGGEVARMVNGLPFKAIIGGWLSFYSAMLSKMLVYHNKRVRLRAEGLFDEEIKIRNVAIANGQYHGGGMRVAPKASLDDGLFDVVVFGDISRLDLMLSSGRLYKGTHLSHPKVRFFRGEKLKATSKQKVFLEIDGETLGTLPVQFEILPGALNLVI